MALVVELAHFTPSSVLGCSIFVVPGLAAHIATHRSVHAHLLTILLVKSVISILARFRIESGQTGFTAKASIPVDAGLKLPLRTEYMIKIG